MKKLYYKLIGFLLIWNFLLLLPALSAVDTRLYSNDIKPNAGCFTATTVGGMTCYQQGVDATISGSVTADTELSAAAASADAFANPTAGGVLAFPNIFNGTTWDRIRAWAHGVNTAGTGILNTVGLLEFDDVAPTSITENQAGTLRGSANRNLYTTLRDAAGNERGANVTAANELNVLDSNSGAIKTSVELIDNAVSGAGFNITQFGGAAVPIGAGLEATALRCTLPTDGTGKVNAAQSGTWNINNVSGTVSLPTGASTLAEQQTQTTALQLIDNIVSGTGANVSQVGGANVQNATNGLDSAGTGIQAQAPTFQFDDAATSSVTENQFAHPRLSSRRAVLVEGVASGTAIPVSGTVTATASGTQDTNLTQIGGNTVDTGSGTGGMATQRVITDTASTVGTVTTLTGSGVAHGAADSGNPHKVGYKAQSTLPTKVDDADRVDAWGDLSGRSVVAVECPRELKVRQLTTITASTAETTILTAGAANVFHDVFYIRCYNSSATNTAIQIRDATAGSVLERISCPAKGSGDGGGWGAITLPQTTAANNWTAQADDSVSSLYVAIAACKSK